ncbi:Meiotically up-regulated gene 163 protein [Neolecta irregularis DAH-3]|uniref:Meiotically up-regulated gene 163 protein n=1 Tax=Neolecta irregularis (strain DAH-3) TaxID=1198029 RepID=A0A1U7LQ95_NEOID|nr:Meiotically up-regulated gene 163 protein [Neolecta irregularis DAH-3]|eukprot:OLL24827.1 Meiotically up-regulated gene 163 protein [Neolecta irregularis DAH-3]
MHTVLLCLSRNCHFFHRYLFVDALHVVSGYRGPCRRIINTPYTLCTRYPIPERRSLSAQTVGRHSSSMLSYNEDSNPPPDPQNVNMGKSIETIREHLCNLFYNPLPSDILAPTVTLEFLPGQFPELPKVNGRLAYAVAMRLLQISGAPRQLCILSERIVDRKMTVKWEAETTGSESSHWTGWFYFSFDESGLVSKQVIENVERPFSNINQPSGSNILGWTKWLLRSWGARKLKPALIREMERR